jgi:hypothetical protein
MSAPPPCWTEPEWTWQCWLQLARVSSTWAREPCVDCSLDYAAEMRARGLCRHPEWTPRPPYVQPLPSEGACQLDGTLLAEHPRCRRCEILVGPRHVAKDLERELCAECRRESGAAHG